MAQGPDPNRWQPPEPQDEPREQADAGGLGNPRSSRLGLPSWAIVLLAAIVVALIFFFVSERPAP
jgi:hypothetical protein